MGRGLGEAYPAPTINQAGKNNVTPVATEATKYSWHVPKEMKIPGQAQTDVPVDADSATTGTGLVAVPAAVNP